MSFNQIATSTEYSIDLPLIQKNTIPHAQVAAYGALAPPGETDRYRPQTVTDRWGEDRYLYRSQHRHCHATRRLSDTHPPTFSSPHQHMYCHSHAGEFRRIIKVMKIQVASACPCPRPSCCPFPGSSLPLSLTPARSCLPPALPLPQPIPMHL
jgi:hypothetical protein